MWPPAVLAVRVGAAARVSGGRPRFRIEPEILWPIGFWKLNAPANGGARNHCEAGMWRHPVIREHAAAFAIIA